MIDCYLTNPFVFMLGLAYHQEEKVLEVMLGFFIIVFSWGDECYEL